MKAATARSTAMEDPAQLTMLGQHCFEAQAYASHSMALQLPIQLQTKPIPAATAPATAKPRSGLHQGIDLDDLRGHEYPRAERRKSTGQSLARAGNVSMTTNITTSAAASCSSPVRKNPNLPGCLLHANVPEPRARQPSQILKSVRAAPSRPSGICEGCRALGSGTFA